MLGLCSTKIIVDDSVVLTMNEASHSLLIFIWLAIHFTGNKKGSTGHLQSLLLLWARVVVTEVQCALLLVAIKSIGRSPPMNMEHWIWNVFSEAVSRHFVLSWAPGSCFVPISLDSYGVRLFLYVPYTVFLGYHFVLCCVKVVSVIRRSIWELKKVSENRSRNKALWI